MSGWTGGRMESSSVDGRDGGLKNSLGLEALAIFGIVGFLVRIVVDVAQRIRNGRSFSRQQPFLTDLSNSVLSMITAAARLYDDHTDHTQ